MNKNKGYTFDVTTRYITRGINEQVPVNLQMLLWDKVDRVVSSTLPADYLQMFTFEKTKENKLLIYHKQEQPMLEASFEIPLNSQNEKLIGKKVYIIDDIDHSTMLFADEY